MSDHAPSPELFDAFLEALPAAPAGRRPKVIKSLLGEARRLLEDGRGLMALAERAGRFDAAGLFLGTVWSDPCRLQPALVKPSLLAPDPTGVTEALSELRLLAYALGHARSERMTREEARAFLERALALALDLIAPDDSEERRAAGPERGRSERLCAYLAEALGLDSLLSVVAVELDQLMSQRPILVARAWELLRLSRRVKAGERPARLERYLAALEGPTHLSASAADPARYAAILRGAGPDELRREARAFGRSLRGTGLACPAHAALVNAVRDRACLELALDLNASGRAELAQHHRFVVELIRACILPQTTQALYGLARVLERGLLSRPELRAGLRRLLGLELAPAVADRIGSAFGADVPANARLAAGALSVLGQPLGLGQGANPTCQSARGLSLWAQLAPSYLLTQLAYAARVDHLELLFEGELLRTDELSEHGLAPRLDDRLDPVSLVLVPHLDRLYDAMMHRVGERGSDGHRFVNPALYGPWVGPHMVTVFELPFREFARRFYASHHPDYSQQYGMVHPTPVGLFVTNAHGALLGRHAVTLQRVMVDLRGEVRAYFYNPNNDSRQDWGQGVVVDVEGHGEAEGECSLPIHAFTSRLYAFHYTLYEDAWGAAVPDAELDPVIALARDSWGRSEEGRAARFAE